MVGQLALDLLKRRIKNARLERVNYTVEGSKLNSFKKFYVCEPEGKLNNNSIQINLMEIK